MDEIDDAREYADRSEIIDSGLERVEAVTDGRLEFGVKPGNVSIAQRLNPDFCAIAMAEQIEGRREPQALTAGVLAATDDGVSCGVGSGPMRAKAGVGGAMSGLGSKNRGSIVFGVGVPS